MHDNNIGIRDFYGDWFSVPGISDAGYYFDYRFIEKLYRRYSIKDIAALPFTIVEKGVMDYLNDSL